MNEISAVIIAFNEAGNIARCIDSVRNIADEVLVVDSFSTDQTVDISILKGARVIQQNFAGHIQQKNFAMQQAKHDWVLSLDADEELSVELQQLIAHAKTNLHAAGYTMNRLNFFCGKPIKTCGWYPDKKLRLWNRTKGKWDGMNPHDKVEMESGSRLEHFPADILHNTYPTHSDFLAQRIKFAHISAQHLKNKNLLYLVVKMVFSPSAKFLRTYFFHLGFTEGTTGFFICYHLSREVFLKYCKAIQLKHR